MGSLWNYSLVSSIGDTGQFSNMSNNSTPDNVNRSSMTLIDNRDVSKSVIMFTSGFLGNVLALYVLITSPSEQRRTIFYRLVAGLACTDLIGTTLTSPFVIAVYMNRNWFGGEYMCNYFGFVMIFAGYATMLIVCTMSIERVICIKHPYIYYTRLTKKHATIFLVFCWIFSVIIASLPVMGFGKIIKKYPGTWCFIDYYSKTTGHIAYNYLYGVLAMCIISVTVFCNLTVIVTLLKSRRQRGLLNDRNGSTRKYNGYSKRFAECQMLCLLIGITIVFSSCYVPMMVRIIMNQTGLVKKNAKVDLTLIYMASFNQILDPWVYILLRREMVWKFIAAVKCLLRIKPKEPDLYPGNQKHSAADTEDDNCCVFCLHCLCDPPTNKNRHESRYSRDSIYGDRRSVVICNTPTSIKKSISTTDSKLLTSSNKEIHKLLATISSQKNTKVENDLDSI